MSIFQRVRLTRRRFLWTTLLSGFAVVVAACRGGDDSKPAATATRGTASTAAEPTAAATAGGTAQVLAPTPACGDDDDETIAQTEGPYFTPNSPERASLVEDGMAGTRLTVRGQVLSTDCQPVARALVDFWQANDAGEYDNDGYTLRGHQFTDEQGNYQLETIVPGLYTGRTRHIHVKVQAPERDVLTTQLYFPGEPDNQSDGIFDQSLVMDVEDSAAGKAATFNFVLDVS